MTDIERLARKLAPLMPQEVGQWLRARDLCDPELKQLIDQQIVSVAHRMLGDFRSKLLLSLPQEQRIKGEINLGTVLYESAKWPAGISRAELLQNLAIFGRSGSGKTNVAFHILKQLDDKAIPFLFLDWKQTGRHLLPRLHRKVNVFTPGRALSEFPFNPFIVPPGLDQSAYVNQLVDVMADAYTLGDGAKSIVQKALTGCYETGVEAPTVGQLLQAVEKMLAQDRQRGWKISAVRALQSMAFAKMTSTKNSTQAELIEDLLETATIVELDALSQASKKKFLIPLLCLWLYRVRLASPQRESLSLVILLEEAHHLLHGSEQRARETLMEMLLRQCREIGIAIIVVDQHPHLISSAALGNTYTSICLNQKDPKDLNKAAALSLVDEHDKHWLSKLSTGQAIVKLQDRWTSPFLIQVPLVQVRKGAVSDGMLARFVNKSRSGSGARRRLLKEGGQVQQVQLADHVLDDNGLALLQDVLTHPDDGVKVRYRRLGVGGGTGDRLKRELIEQGWLADQMIRIGRSRKLLLGLTKDAKAVFGIESGAVSNASMAHEYWKHFYAQWLRNNGYEVQIEASRNGGRVDVLATKNNHRVAIEIETGRSDVIANVKRCLHAGFEQVIVAATTQEALQRMEQALARAGLLIVGRVALVRCGERISVE